MHLVKLINIVLCGASLALFLLTQFVLNLGEITSNVGTVATYTTPISLATIFAAFVLTIKKGSYLTAATLSLMATFQIYQSYTNLLFLQNPALIGSVQFADYDRVTFVMGLVMLAMAFIAVIRRRKSGQAPLKNVDGLVR